MAATNLKALTSKLAPVCLRTLEGAAGLCLSKTHFNVEIEHWLLKLLETPETDLELIIRHYNLDKGRLIKELNSAVDKFKSGNGRAPSLSPDISELIRVAWLIASVDMNSQRIRSGHLLGAMLSDRDISSGVRSSSAELASINAETLLAELPKILAQSKEDPGIYGTTSDIGAGAPVKVNPNSKTPNLDQFTQNLTDAAKQGKIEHVIGRDP
ncbi:MAG: Clp protease N-terminal domain-containing protein, partial [Planctomycetia bacterium]